MFPPSIQKLIEKFAKFPTIGPRTAARFVFYLLEKPKTEIDELTSAILDLKNKIKLCGFCFNPFEPFDAAQAFGSEVFDSETQTRGTESVAGQIL